MHKFFVPVENINHSNVIVKGDDVKHIYKVLRLHVGDEILVNNSCGIEYLCKIKSLTKDEVLAEILEESTETMESPLYINLFQGLPKSTKMDLIVQKNTELGVSEITPVITERVVVKTELKEYKKLDRWNRIALEASKQCKRNIIPTINVPIEFKTMIENLVQYDLILVPYENQHNIGLKKVIDDIKKNINIKDMKKVAIIIGPEGGFETSEIETLRNNGSYIITLGPRILRTETAGFTAVSLISYELGDLGGNI